MGLRGFLRAGLAATPVAIVSLLAGGPAQAAIVGASCPAPQNGFATLSNQFREAQSFTVQRAGTVVGASFVIDKQSPGGDFQVQVLATENGVPVNGALTSATIPDASVPMGTSTQSVALSAAILTHRTYALALGRPGSGIASVGTRNDSACPGREFFSFDQDDPWLDGTTGVDLIYQLSVEPTNQFFVKTVIGRKVTVHLPGPGTVLARDARPRRQGRRPPKLVKTVQVSANESPAGDTFLVLPLTRSGRLALKEHRRPKARVTITYTPTGGQPNTLQVGVPLRNPRR